MPMTYHIAFTIMPIKEDFYYQSLYLQLSHNDSDLVVYSNAFFVTAEETKNTFRLDYKGFDVYDGTHYNIFSFYQSIRLFGFLETNTPKEDSQIYTQLNGVVRKSRVIKNIEKQYNLPLIDTNNIDAFYSAINSDVCYLNGVRVIPVQPPTIGERIGMTNLMPLTQLFSPIETDTFIDVPQIVAPLTIVSKTPLGNYTLATIPTTGQATFNFDIFNNGATIRLYDYDTDALLNTISIDSNFEFTMPILPNGNYYILTNIITDVNGQTVQVTSKEDWKFTIGAGDFDNTDFNTIDFFTN